jgi:hypothetical protein
MDNVAATFAMGINDPRPAGWRVTALQKPHDQPAALSLSATISQYFIGGMKRVQLACARHQQDTKKR